MDHVQLIGELTDAVLPLSSPRMGSAGSARGFRQSVAEAVKQ